MVKAADLMAIQKQKIIRDLVHGFIEIDDGVIRIIDHRSFQRLKNISQLTAHHLFPSVNHTRFEHSIGVMHMALKFFDSLSAQLRENGVDDDEIGYLRFHLKFAALLHDVGHAPFSHVGENFYNNVEIETKLKDIHPDSGEWIKNGAPHEKMSCYVIATNFTSTMWSLWADLSISNYSFDIEFIFRIITGGKYTGSDDDWKKNIIIEVLNSKSIDADKIDYLIRDNVMSGSVAPSFNLDRLFYSIRIDNVRKIAFSQTGLSSIVNLIDCKDFLYIWLYNHHIVVYTDFLYHTAIDHLSSEENSISSNKIRLEDYFSCDAIAKRYISNNDITVVLNEEFNRSDSIYSKTILSQLFERNLLKPLWKTIFEYNQFMNEHFDDRQRKEIEEIITNSDMRRSLTRELQVRCSIRPGEVFIVQRSNRFISMSKAEFYIVMDGKDIDIDKAIPQRKFEQEHSNVAFYVFAREEKLHEIKGAIIETLIIRARDRSS